jgi:hypothetical protein
VLGERVEDQLPAPSDREVAEHVSEEVLPVEIYGAGAGGGP